MSFDAVERVEDYITQRSWKVRENSNITYSFSGMFFRVAGGAVEEYVLRRVYPQKISKAHIDGDFHIHNLYMGICGYCAGWDFKTLLAEGFGGVKGKISAKPPRHFDVALLQAANFLGSLQNEWAGAQALNGVDTFLAPYVREDKVNYKKLKQGIQTLIYNLNVTTRWGGQTPFTNFTMDWKVPRDVKDENIVLGGKLTTRTYADYQQEVDNINKAFLEILIEGDAEGKPFTFPIPTYNLTKDFDWESENAKLLFEMTAKYGLAYFSNFINTNMNPSDIRSMCCHLRLDLRQLKRNITGGLFGSSSTTGSVGVVTINMPRIGYLSKNEGEFFERLEKLMVLAKESLEIKRNVVQKNIDNGFLPLTKRFLGSLRNHFSTVGLVGMNEACLNFLGGSIATGEGKKLATKTLKFMRKKLLEFQNETGNLYNLEATPAEGSSYELALFDKKKFKNIITAGKKDPYYTNSTWLPLPYTDDVVGALKFQEELQTLYTGGTVFHAYVGERISAEGVKEFLKMALTKTKIPYITLTPTFSVCPNHGYLAGEHWKCPKCKEECGVYSRVVGYFRPVQNWNRGKQADFADRKMYRIR